MNNKFKKLIEEQNEIIRKAKEKITRIKKEEEEENVVKLITSGYIEEESIMTFNFKNFDKQSRFKHCKKPKKLLRFIFFLERKGRTIQCTLKDRETKEIVGMGISKCSPEDDFSEDIGIDLAITRATIDFYKRLEKSIQDGERYSRKSIKIRTDSEFSARIVDREEF